MDVPSEPFHHSNGETDSSSSSSSSSTSTSTAGAPISLAGLSKDEIFARGKEAYDDKRYSEAQEMFREAAEQGQKEACMFLGLMYRYGFGVAQDFSIALDWYRQAADAFPDDCQAQIVFLEKRVKQQASQIPPIDIEVTGTRKHQDAGAKPWTEYIVTISAGGNTWEIRKRYRLFENFHKTLEATFGPQITVPLGFPPKKWLGSMDQEFVQKRKQNLQSYLQRLAAKPEIVNSTAFLNFIQYYEHIPKKQ